MIRESDNYANKTRMTATRKNEFSQAWPQWPAYVLFFMMLFVPTVYQPIKAGLLGLVLGLIIIATLLYNRFFLHRSILLWTLGLAAAGLGFMLLGVMHDAPGALRVGTVYVLWPLVYAVLVAGTATDGVIDRLMIILIVSTIAIPLYTLSYVLHARGWLPDALYIRLDQGQAIGFYRGWVEYNLYSMSSLFFLVPYVLAALLSWPRHFVTTATRFWLWIALILGLMVAVLSGRRALWLVLGVAPVIAMSFRHFLPGSHKQVTRHLTRRMLLGATLGLIAAYVWARLLFGVDVHAMAQDFLLGFGFQHNPSAMVRRGEFYALLDGWAKNPLLGAGLGASAAGLVRSEAFPWAYELSYIALLFHTGIIGILIYATAVTWIFYQGRRMIRSGHRLGMYMLPTLVGTSCFLMANATNPYLEKYDYLWVIFLPVALINAWLLGRQKRAVFVSNAIPSSLGNAP